MSLDHLEITANSVEIEEKKSDEVSNSIAKSTHYDTLSSDDEEYGDEQDLMSISSTIVTSLRNLKSITSVPNCLEGSYWSEPCGSSFRVRSGTYLKSRKKGFSDKSLFRLLAMDLCEVSEMIRTGFCAHPTQRVQKALQRERQGTGVGDMPAFVFCINLMIPPKHHAVFYYAVDDMSQIRYEEGEVRNDPFKNIAHKFFFGDSDKFRDSTFKLVPRIVKGNYVVKKAVGSKPTLLGKKLTQKYVRDDRFFEIMVDIGSSSIATKVVKLASGYAKTLVVDMGFLLEGKSSSTLPERIMGTMRLNKIDFAASRHVEQP